MGKCASGASEAIRQITLMLKDLQPYLLSETLYGPGKQSLSPGNLLLWFNNSQPLSDQPELDDELRELTNQFDYLRTRWLSLWQRKVAREFENRINRWQDYMDEMLSGERSMAVYRYQVRHRVILQLLTRELSMEITASTLTALDDKLQFVSTPDIFIWHPKLESVYPLGTYWYLYRKLNPV